MSNKLIKMRKRVYDPNKNSFETICEEQSCDLCAVAFYIGNENNEVDDMIKVEISTNNRPFNLLGYYDGILSNCDGTLFAPPFLENPTIYGNIFPCIGNQINLTIFNSIHLYNICGHNIIRLTSVNNNHNGNYGKVTGYKVINNRIQDIIFSKVYEGNSGSVNQSYTFVYNGA